MKSFIEVTKESDFSIYNIPFGIYNKGEVTAACTRIGDTIVDLDKCLKVGVFNGIDLPSDVFLRPILNDFIALGKNVTSAVRLRLQDVLQQGGALDSDKYEKSGIFLSKDLVRMLLPLRVGDYTDFYSSREHATNVGSMFRDPNNALLPNWLHMPIGYHGRASSIVVSGTKIKRPKGQILQDDPISPVYKTTKQLDFELEMAFVIGKNTELGQTVSTDEAEDYIFGLMLFNDWSARDIQRWEYVPLGPFLGKNFASTVSPWIVTLEALEPFKVAGPEQEVKVLPYLEFNGLKNYDIHLSVDIMEPYGEPVRVSTSNFKYMYWNMCQQLAHHTVNGCNIRVGDMMASGTISGPTPDTYGSMLEITWRGTKPVLMTDGSERRFINNGDTVKMRGWAEKEGVRVGFGPCDGTILQG